MSRLWTTMYRQFRKPAGALGGIAGLVMAIRPSNRDRNYWTVDLLDLQPTDSVLEIGYGPGVAIERVLARVPQGRVVGIDHSEVMLRQARARNRAAIDAGLLVLHAAGVDTLGQPAERFDKVFSVNVFQFLKDKLEAIRRVRAVMREGGLFATTYMPRHRGAVSGDAERWADEFTDALDKAGLRDIRVERLDIKPMPAVCVLARDPRPSPCLGAVRRDHGAGPRHSAG